MLRILPISEIKTSTSGIAPQITAANIKFIITAVVVRLKIVLNNNPDPTINMHVPEVITII